MDQPIYVRVRGKTQGPYTVEQLQGLASRGQFSRLHEISIDGVEWKRAATIPELFAKETNSSSVGHGFFQEPISLPSSGEEYFLRVRGRTCGPYTEEHLRSLAAKGQFSRLHEISKDGTSWFRASSVPSLFPERVVRPKQDASHTVQAASAAAPIRPGTTQPITDDDEEEESGEYQLERDSEPPEELPDEPERWSVPWSWILLAALVAISLAAAAAAIIAWRSPELLSLGGKSQIISSVQDDQSIAGAVALIVCGCRIVLEDGTELESPRSSGSGFAISPNGYIATNKHVIEEISNLQKATLLLDKIRKEKLVDVQPRVWAFFGPNEKYVAQIIHVSERYDTAILKINRDTGPYFRLSADSKLGRGQKVFALGFPAAARVALSDEEKVESLVREVQEGENSAKTVQSHFKPRDFDFALTTGNVSRVINESEGRCWVQHNADINPGNSGGPLVSESGVVIGINTGVARQSNGVYFSLSMPQLRPELQQYVKSLQWQ